MIDLARRLTGSPRTAGDTTASAGPELRLVPGAAPPLPKPSYEDSLRAALTRDVAGETIAVAFARREQDLRALFGQLTLDESRTLYRRLAQPSSDDGLARLFGRMVPERRNRLLVFLADARRRIALKGGR